MLPRYLPSEWKGGFVLLVLVFVLSSFLDNIAAAMIGGGIAATVFQRKVHIGYLAAIVAASNAGGAGSVVGDTTTTMIWIAGASPLQVLDAYVAGGAGAAVLRRDRGAAAARLPADPGGHAIRGQRSTGRAFASSRSCWCRRSAPTSGSTCTIPAVLEPFPGNWRGGVGRDPGDGPLAKTRLGRCARRGQGQRCSCCRWC